MKGDTAKERVSKQSLRRVSDRIRLGQREREGREECECAHRRLLFPTALRIDSVETEDRADLLAPWQR